MTRVLGIETSCDESAVALVEGEGEQMRILHNAVSSQTEIHKKYGGVVPEVAARAHVQALAGLIRESGIKNQDVDAIAVTAGPGLITALRVGIDTARALSWAWGKPLIGINHIEGHIYSNWIQSQESRIKNQELRMGDVFTLDSQFSIHDSPTFPALCLIVSGGHTELLLMRGHGEYERLGETLDDAVGEAFDKVAKLLGLSYPGGPAISKAAETGDAQKYNFPRPMAQDATLNFSYSGLKTAVRVKIQKDFPKPSATRKPPIGGNLVAGENELNDLAASFQAAAIDPLIIKTERALQRVNQESGIKNQEGAQSIIVAGGVSANTLLRARLAELAGQYQIPLFMPDLKLTGDNAAMIAAAGYFRRSEARGDTWETLEPRANWSLGHEPSF